MTASKLARFVLHNTLRNRRSFTLSAFGIVIGIAAFVFFLALSTGVEAWVLGDWFPVERVEVVAPRTTLFGISARKKLTDDTVALIRAYPGVRGAVPRMTINFPIFGYGYFEGNRIELDVVGDGVDPAFVEDKHHELFRDWDADADQAALQPCGPAPHYACEGVHYCDRRDNLCHHRVPVLVSKNLLEIYNTQIAETRGLPVIGGFEQFMAERGGLVRMTLHLDLGASMIKLGDQLRAPPRRVQGMIMGISERAIPIGVTVPIEYVKRWNREFRGDEAAREYSSIVVTLGSADQIAEFGRWIEREHDLRLQDSVGEQFAQVILIVTLLFLLIALVIVVISAINIAHTFFMQVSERRREIGVLRAVGATRADVRAIFLGEAALIGVVVGVVGIGVAFGASLVADPILGGRKLPFQPESFFRFEWWILAGGLLFAVVFCVLGGLLPSRVAARLAPAQALAQQ